LRWGFLPVLVVEIVHVGWGSCGVVDVYVMWASRELRTGSLLLFGSGGVWCGGPRVWGSGG
jgi:hypothetical protein